MFLWQDDCRELACADGSERGICRVFKNRSEVCLIKIIRSAKDESA